MRAKDVLLEALTKYNGTVVFVSHDRYFIDKLATRVFEVGAGRVEIYPGNYEDYCWRKQGGARRLEEELAASTAVVEPARGNGSERQPGSEESKSRRLNPIKRKQMEDRVRELEGQISRNEAAISDCETALQTFVTVQENARLAEDLSRHKKELESRLEEWEDLSERLKP
jgi:ATP-binding cassette, subfamily F, member 3